MNSASISADQTRRYLAHVTPKIDLSDISAAKVVCSAVMILGNDLHPMPSGSSGSQSAPRYYTHSQQSERLAQLAGEAVDSGLTVAFPCSGHLIVGPLGAGVVVGSPRWVVR